MNKITQGSVPEGVIDDQVLERIGARLEKGKLVRQALPLGGFIHIDRQLPFLVLYRRPEKRRDDGTDQLLRGEASYLIASDNPKMRPSLAKLLKTVIEAQEQNGNAFLVIEVWSDEHVIKPAESAELCQVPEFRIIASDFHPPTSTVEALARALKSARVQKQRALVHVDLAAERTPVSLKPLFSVAEARKLNCSFIGLEVKPCFRNPETGELYPLVLRRLHRDMSKALQRAFFEFAHSMTDYRPASHQVLGKRAMVRTVWEVDRKLADISRSFDLILLATPINIEKAWSQFKKARYEKMPALYYRPLPVDPDALKRQLYQIPIDHIEDPTLGLLFRQKRQELDRRLSMLLERGRVEFLYGSFQLFGVIDKTLQKVALQILNDIPPHTRDESMKHKAYAGDLAARAEEVLAVYRETYPAMTSSVQIREDILGLMVSGGNLLIGKDTKVARSRVDALIHHEVSTHILTYLNGLYQPFQQLYCGLAGYDGLQEGLAVLAEYLVGGLSRSRLRLLAGRVMAVHYLVDGATFAETYHMLNQVYGFNQRIAFAVTIRIYRGGGLTKDAIYLRGLIELLGYLKKGGELDLLYIGKIAIEHVPLIRELKYREVLKEPPLRPVYCAHNDFQEKMSKLKKGLSPLDLV